jgi:CubicO group peptidase (beta-lactamase class C family)
MTAARQQTAHHNVPLPVRFPLLLRLLLLAALVVGVAVTLGLVDLDTPIVKYGVEPSCEYPSHMRRRRRRRGARGNYSGCWAAVNCTGAACPVGPRGWFDNITARHLLSQASGCVTGVGCTAPPGTQFTYDSDQYIQHLSHLITAVTGMPAVEWATKHFAAPLGIPDLYIYDVDGGPDVRKRAQYFRSQRELSARGWC